MTFVSLNSIWENHHNNHNHYYFPPCSVHYRYYNQLMMIGLFCFIFIVNQKQENKKQNCFLHTETTTQKNKKLDIFFRCKRIIYVFIFWLHNLPGFVAWNRWNSNVDWKEKKTNFFFDVNDWLIIWNISSTEN